MSYHSSRSRFRGIAITALTCLVFTAAQAQMKGDFDAADSNHDGHVSFEEFAAYATQQLDNANGRKAQKFKQLSGEQQTTVLRKRFGRADRRHKGYLDRGDWSGANG
jgi:Ca2+-binding EF-hand superfamily protein